MLNQARPNSPIICNGFRPEDQRHNTYCRDYQTDEPHKPAVVSLITFLILEIGGAGVLQALYTSSPAIEFSCMSISCLSSAVIFTPQQKKSNSLNHASLLAAAKVNPELSYITIS